MPRSVDIEAWKEEAAPLPTTIASPSFSGHLQGSSCHTLSITGDADRDMFIIYPFVYIIAQHGVVCLSSITVAKSLGGGDETTPTLAGCIGIVVSFLPYCRIPIGFARSSSLLLSSYLVSLTRQTFVNGDGGHLLVLQFCRGLMLRRYGRSCRPYGGFEEAL
jgi:hypothetical protein